MPNDVAGRPLKDAPLPTDGNLSRSISSALDAGHASGEPLSGPDSGGGTVHDAAPSKEGSRDLSVVPPGYTPGTKGDLVQATSSSDNNDASGTRPGIRQRLLGAAGVGAMTAALLTGCSFQEGKTTVIAKPSGTTNAVAVLHETATDLGVTTIGHMVVDRWRVTTTYEGGNAPVDLLQVNKGTQTPQTASDLKTDHPLQKPGDTVSLTVYAEPPNDPNSSQLVAGITDSKGHLISGGKTGEVIEINGLSFTVTESNKAVLYPDQFTTGHSGDQTGIPDPFPYPLEKNTSDVTYKLYSTDTVSQILENTDTGKTIQWDVKDFARGTPIPSDSDLKVGNNITVPNGSTLQFPKDSDTLAGQILPKDCKMITINENGDYYSLTVLVNGVSTEFNSGDVYMVADGDVVQIDAQTMGVLGDDNQKHSRWSIWNPNLPGQ